ncbi:glutaminase [Nostoc sp. UIC 10607]|uniref:glutaminase n=1 Tax=Nostoc sp. UIC 10607 TaxID=3045935 RepID=UPI0039A26B6C
MTNAEKILCKQWQGGYELYGRDGFLSGEGAGRIVRTVLGLPCTFTDFDCKTPSDPLSFERFERIADRITSRAVGVDPILKEIFDTVGGQPDSLFVTPRQIRQAIEAVGIRPNDPRLGDLGTRLVNGDLDERLSPSRFLALVASNVFLISRILRRDLAVPDFDEFRRDLDSLYELVEPNHSGANADYIPVLRDADPERWGVAFCSVDGQRYARGHVNDFFSIQSTSKPITYGLALREIGSVRTHEWIGMEPSGRPFNHPELLPDQRPYNPMVNAGAIMTCSVLASAFEGVLPRELIDYVASIWERMCGSLVRLSEETMLSEKATADNNFALAYLMRGRVAAAVPHRCKGE